MNRFLSHQVENALEFLSGPFRRAPSQFRLPATEEWRLTPTAFYAAPQAAPAPVIVARRPQRDGGARCRFRYPSPYPSPHPVNNTVYGLADLRPEGQARSALILLHGHSMGTFAPLELMAVPLKRLGWDIYYIALPYHMQRRPPGTWCGQYAYSADIGRTLQAFKQSVLDVRALMQWIGDARGQPVALAGVSYGAYVACLTALVDPRPAAVIALMAGASLAAVPFAGRVNPALRADLRAGGVTREELERYWALLGPGHWQPVIPKERILLLAGRYDPSVTPENVTELWQAWGEPALKWYPCGHTTMFFYYRTVRQDMAMFLA